MFDSWCGSHDHIVTLYTFLHNVTFTAKVIGEVGGPYDRSVTGFCRKKYYSPLDERLHLGNRRYIAVTHLYTWVERYPGTKQCGNAEIYLA